MRDGAGPRWVSVMMARQHAARAPGQRVWVRHATWTRQGRVLLVSQSLPAGAAVSMAHPWPYPSVPSVPNILTRTLPASHTRPPLLVGRFPLGGKPGACPRAAPGRRPLRSTSCAPPVPPTPVRDIRARAWPRGRGTRAPLCKAKRVRLASGWWGCPARANTLCCVQPALLSAHCLSRAFKLALRCSRRPTSCLASFFFFINMLSSHTSRLPSGSAQISHTLHIRVGITAPCVLHLPTTTHQAEAHRSPRPYTEHTTQANTPSCVRPVRWGTLPP